METTVDTKRDRKQIPHHEISKSLKIMGLN